MPRPSLTWRRLTVGLVTLAVTAAIAIWVLTVAQVGGLRGRKATIYILSPDVEGVIRGTEVWFAGTQIGIVNRMAIHAGSTDPMARVLIQAQVLDAPLRRLRRNALAQIHPGQTMIGTAVVDILPSQGVAPFLAPGDTIRSRPTVVLQTAGERVAVLTDEVSGVAKDVKGVTGSFRATMRRIRQTGQVGERGVHSARDKFSTLLEDAMRGEGSVSRTIRDTALLRHARLAMAGIDSFVQRLHCDSGDVARLQRDTALPNRMVGLRLAIDSVQHAWGAQGPLLGLPGDSAVHIALARAQKLLDSLKRDMRIHPFRYLGRDAF